MGFELGLVLANSNHGSTDMDQSQYGLADPMQKLQMKSHESTNPNQIMDRIESVMTRSRSKLADP